MDAAASCAGGSKRSRDQYTAVAERDRDENRQQRRPHDYQTTKRTKLRGSDTSNQVPRQTEPQSQSATSYAEPISNYYGPSTTTLAAP